MKLILASKSKTRIQILSSAGLNFISVDSLIDEKAIKAALLQEKASIWDIPDILAENKALKVASKYPLDIVLGCDQILEFENKVISKPTTKEQAKEQLLQLKGKNHRLICAVVLYEAGSPVWRHTSEVSLTMRNFSDRFLNEYIDKNWPEISSSVGAYQIEKEGIRLFDSIVGDYFTILGMPLLPLLTYLGQRKIILS